MCLNVFIPTNLGNMELKFFFFVLVYTTFGIDWDTHWYTLGHCIYL